VTGARDGRGLPDNTVGPALFCGPNVCLSTHHAELQVVMTFASLARKTASVSLSDIVARFAVGGASGAVPQKAREWGEVKLGASLSKID
jgi:hypothetical protein